MTPSSGHMQSNASCVMSQQLPHHITPVRKKQCQAHSDDSQINWGYFYSFKKGENVICKYDSCLIHSLAKVVGGGGGGDCYTLSGNSE